ncbi:MAG: hypothetical protein R3A13_09825 [Bdellovibrionota bacterium]
MYKFLSIYLIISLVSCSNYYPKNLRHLLQAENLTKHEKYDEAFSEYELHIKTRSQQPDLQQWENPYFYQLIIGDLQLKLKNPSAALKSYLKAEENGVSTILVNDRIRLVANWYESEKEYDKAINLLEKYRTRDSLMFDLMLDRLSKKIVSIQDKTSSSSDLAK